MSDNFIISSHDGQQTPIYLHNFNEVISNYIKMTHNFFEIEFLKFIQKSYPNHHDIIDIGANIGNHSLFFAKFLNCKKIHAFEPVDTNLQLLQKNLQDYETKCIIYDMALSNCQGMLPLYTILNKRIMVDFHYILIPINPVFLFERKYPSQRWILFV